MNLEKEGKTAGQLYAYICICARMQPLRLYLHLYIWASHLYVQAQAFRLKGSMYEFSCTDYIVFHVHMEKEKRSSQKKKKEKRTEISGKSQNFRNANFVGSSKNLLKSKN